MSNTSLLGSFGGLGDSSLMFRNVLINGCFRVWQRGTSQTSSDYGSDDRWFNLGFTSTKTHSRQTFTLGQTDVPGNPQYFSRTVVSSVANANAAVLKRQKIESVATFAGQTATLSFWAKADATKNMAVEFTQNFGSGGTPSASINSIGVTTIPLTTSWKYYTVTVSIPSISGKTLGTDNNDNLQLDFWFDAGSVYNARTNNLGQQSGTFDIAQVQLEAGPTATPFERRPFGMELALCQRYYQRGNLTVGTSSTFGGQQWAYGTAPNSNWIGGNLPFKVEMRDTPTIRNSGVAGTINTILRGSTGTDVTVTLSSNKYGTFGNFVSAAFATSETIMFAWDANAEL